MEFNEKDAQSEYEAMVTAAQEKRTTDSKAVSEKKSRSEELMDTKQYLAEVHEDCDWLLQNYETRKEARANEVDAMKKAKAVLSGADYSLVETRAQHHLRHTHSSA